MAENNVGYWTLSVYECSRHVAFERATGNESVSYELYRVADVSLTVLGRDSKSRVSLMAKKKVAIATKVVNGFTFL